MRDGPHNAPGAHGEVLDGLEELFRTMTLEEIGEHPIFHEDVPAYDGLSFMLRMVYAIVRYLIDNK